MSIRKLDLYRNRAVFSKLITVNALVSDLSPATSLKHVVECLQPKSGLDHE